jgi:hypothetical protein
MTSSSLTSLPPADSPLTKVFLGPYLSLLAQETIAFRKISYAELGQELSLSRVIVKEAVQGQIGLTRGQWLRLIQGLRLPTNFELQPSQRNAMLCWEVCYPPVPAGTTKK